MSEPGEQLRPTATAPRDRERDRLHAPGAERAAGAPDANGSTAGQTERVVGETRSTLTGGPSSISTRTRDRLAAPVVVVYWVALVVGLLVASAGARRRRPLRRRVGGRARRHGARAGSGAAQLARLVRRGRRRRPFGLPRAPARCLFDSDVDETVTLWQVLVPAVLCGYWSLGERTAPAAFWFPAMIWMLSVVDALDGFDAAATMDARAFVLLGGVVAAFLALLWAAERRRLGLAGVVGRAPTVAGRVSRLREPAGHSVARVAWWAAVGAMTLSLMAWVAPHLWQPETLGGQKLSQSAGRCRRRRWRRRCPVARWRRLRRRAYVYASSSTWPTACGGPRWL